MPTAAEAAARRGSSARGFPVRKAAKFWSSSCNRRRKSYWGGWIGWRRGGGMGSTGIEAHRRGGSDGEVVPVGSDREEWLGSVSGVRGSSPGGCSGAGRAGVSCP
jgi:hypothetical protein